MTRMSDIAFALLAAWYMHTAGEVQCRLMDRSLGQLGPTTAAQIYCVEEGAETSTLAKFVHLWRFEDGQWRIARVLSFDHQSRPKSEGP